jgi:hypothetical protein
MANLDYYTRCLRVIGEDLLRFTPETLEIQLTEDAFLVQGTSVVKPRDSSHGGVRNVLKSWSKLLEKKPEKDIDQPALKGFKVRYTPQDIDKLDEEWAGKRGQTGKTPDLYSLAEILRTVGRYIDSEEGRLLKITKEDRRVTVHFQDREGNIQAQQCSLMALYKKQQDAISKRGTVKINDIWEKYDL